MRTPWTSMIREAFEVRRSLQAGAGQDEPGAGGLVPVDAIVLTLVLRLLAVDRLVCPDAALGRLLQRSFAEAGLSAPIHVTVLAPAQDHLLLIPLSGLGEAADPSPARKACLAYGLSAGLRLHDLPSAGRDLSLHVLALGSAALWRCGLALVSGPQDERTGTDLTQALYRVMAGEWIDPLALLERVQQLSARLRVAGHIDEDAFGEDDKVARLEREIDLLRRSALIRQHSLLTGVAGRGSAAP